MSFWNKINFYVSMFCIEINFSIFDFWTFTWFCYNFQNSKVHSMLMPTVTKIEFLSKKSTHDFVPKISNSDFRRENSTYSNT